MATRRKKRVKGRGTLIPPRVAEGKWSIRWMEGGVKRYQAGIESQGEAEALLDKIQGEAGYGQTHLPPKAKNEQTLEDLSKAFLELRAKTKEDGRNDAGRWKNHLSKAFGHLKPSQVTQAAVKKFIQTEIADGANPGTLRVIVSLFSVFLDDLGINPNPVKALPRQIKALTRPTHDPRTTPYLERAADIQRVFYALPEPFNVAFAIGVMAGLRTGEVFGLEWKTVDLEKRTIHVVQQLDDRKGKLFKRPKDKESRTVPILDALLPILKAHKLKTKGEGLVIRTDDGRPVHKKFPGPALQEVLVGLKLDRKGLGWYECTRHTFASQWVKNGNDMMRLRDILGHYSVVVTEVYSHLAPDKFSAKDFAAIPLSLQAPGKDEPPVELPRIKDHASL